MRCLSTIFCLCILAVITSGCSTSGTVRPSYEPTLTLERADRGEQRLAVTAADARGQDPLLATFQAARILPTPIHRSNVAFKWDRLQESIALAAREAGWQVDPEAPATLHVELLQAEIAMTGIDLRSGITATTYFVELQATLRHGDTVVARVRRNGSYGGRHVPVHFRRPSNNKLYLLYNRPNDASLIELDYSEALAVAVDALFADKRLVAAIAASQDTDAPEPGSGWVQPEAPPPGAYDVEDEDAEKPGFIEWNF